jgi:hypothetical protein
MTWGNRNDEREEEARAQNLVVFLYDSQPDANTFCINERHTYIAHTSCTTFAGVADRAGSWLA